MSFQFIVGFYVVAMFIVALKKSTITLQGVKNDYLVSKGVSVKCGLWTLNWTMIGLWTGPTNMRIDIKYN